MRLMTPKVSYAKRVCWLSEPNSLDYRSLSFSIMVNDG